MTGLPVEVLRGLLSERDLAVLQDIETYRLLSTRHVQRLHFHQGHSTIGAATRATTRVLARLRGHGLVANLERRIGGVRRGSAGQVWQLAASGDRLLRGLRGQPQRRRFPEPSARFVAHTLAVAELAIQLQETARSRADFSIHRLTVEPTSWQPYLNPHGLSQYVKPDLGLVATSADFEDHWFLEVDLATEHLPVVVRQCRAYQHHAASGRYQAEHGLYPAVLWVTPTACRASAIRRAITADKSLDPRLFRTVEVAQAIPVILGVEATKSTV